MDSGYLNWRIGDGASSVELTNYQTWYGNSVAGGKPGAISPADPYTWNFYVLVGDPLNDSYRLYANGEKRYEVTSSINDVDASGRPLIIG